MSSPPRCVSPPVAIDLEDALMQLEDGNVERAAAEVVHGDDAVALLVQSVSERRRGRLIHQPQHFEAGNASRILRRLTLRVVEVRGNSDDRLRDFSAEEALGVLLELQQDVRGNFGRRKRQAADVELQHFTRLSVPRRA